MNKHPLQFFKDLVFRDMLWIEEKGKFYYYSYTYTPEPYSYKTFITGIGPGESNTKIEISASRFQQIIDNEILNAFDVIDNSLLRIDEEIKQNLYLKTLYKTFNSLIKFIEGDYKEEYYELSESLVFFKDQLVEKYDVFDNPPLKEQDNKTSVKGGKLQWMGQINQLMSLFYDLFSKVENRGKQPLINATRQEVEFFLLSNFIDKDGQDLSHNTIKTALNPSRVKKRALNDDKVDISKYK